MLYLSPGLVLAKPQIVHDNTPLIGWRNLVTAANVTATTADPLFPALNLGNPSTVLAWQASSTDAQYLTVTFSGVVAVDYVALVRHNLGAVGATVSVEGLYDSEWVALSETVVPGSDAHLLFRFEETSPEALRVKIDGVSAPATLAVMYVGKMMPMERGINLDTPHTPLNRGRVTKQVQGFSAAGDYLGTIITGRHSASTEQFSHISRTWFDAEFAPFIEFAAEHPFVYVWRPAEYPDEIGYAKLTSDVTPSRTPKTGRYAVQLQMQGVLA
ncbi:hypothetical protein APY04_0162 [Hyphomicrobium sulfonivorans]|uniref:F5/8 type C domain-containing protein n=1 Tax=Hyphomicrobium sulfonivorans TaxID=121290 RepID=A0A109BP46_HYPSL|nr:hypothetical protein [Hyphomicrobium sulfonivorans]KWT72368.1 hypothetical protein APY04_0162 [Hyphomicrobium sulfonivorans]